MASRNSGKVDELRRLLRAVPWRLVELDQAPGGTGIHWEEEGATYRANAAIKARAVCAGTGFPSLGEDSGIEVKALDGWPGVHTARWMGAVASADQLLAGLTERVAALAPADRGATFVCAVALALPGPRGEIELFESEARLEGTLLTQPRGRQGFGYDPIFVPEGGLHTMAEISQAQKDEVSHRGAAVRKLLSRLGQAVIS
ncbi:MAG: non-canonical purine NTP pyrophosphatase [Candidatus Dormiibacterota bacterium]